MVSDKDISIIIDNYFKFKSENKKVLFDIKRRGRINLIIFEKMQRYDYLNLLTYFTMDHQSFGLIKNNEKVSYMLPDLETDKANRVVFYDDEVIQTLILPKCEVLSELIIESKLNMDKENYFKRFNLNTQEQKELVSFDENNYL